MEFEGRRCRRRRGQKWVLAMGSRHGGGLGGRCVMEKEHFCERFTAGQIKEGIDPGARA
jgi:hypothetical protein